MGKMNAMCQAIYTMPRNPLIDGIHIISFLVLIYTHQQANDY